MSSITVSLIVLACVFGGALFGIFLHSVLPQHHLGADSKDIVKLGMGLVGTMAALVLGLLVASAKDAYDTQNAEVTQMAANIALLDRVLAHYGPEAAEVRAMQRAVVGHMIEMMWSKDGARPAPLAPRAAAAENLFDKIQALSPKNDAQRSLQAQATSLYLDLSKTRLLMSAQEAKKVSMPLLVVLGVWLTFMFISFGLFAPFNATVLSSLFVAALSVSGAIFLILEMYTPFSGIIEISSAPLRAALVSLGK